MASEKVIEIDTRLGRRAIDPDKVINFPRGLPGFEEEHQFTLLQLSPDAPLLVLQSMTRPEVGLLVADPFSFMENYSIEMGEAEEKLLGLASPRDGVVLVTVTIPEGKPQDAMLNLTGPILVNYQSRIGLQIPQAFDGPSQLSLRDAAEQGNTLISAECEN